MRRSGGAVVTLARSSSRELIRVPFSVGNPPPKRGKRALLDQVSVFFLVGIFQTKQMKALDIRGSSMPSDPNGPLLPADPVPNEYNYWLGPFFGGGDLSV